MFPAKDAQRRRDLERQQGVIERARTLLARVEDQLRRSRAMLAVAPQPETDRVPREDDPGRAKEPRGR